MASSPAVVGEDVIVHAMNGHVYVLDRHNGTRALELHDRRADRVVAAGAERRRLLRHLDRDGLRARPEDAPRPLDLPRRHEDHVERLVRGRDGLHRRLRRPPARALGRATAACAGRARSTAASTAPRRPRTAASSCPSSTGGSLTAFSTSGSRLWSLGTGSYVYSSPAVWNGRVYIGSYNGTLYCLSAASGATLWRFDDRRLDRRRGDGRGRRRLLRATGSTGSTR